MSDVKNWSTVASGNNATPPNGWPENMAPSAVNNSARENMAAIKRAYLNFPYFCPGGTVAYVNDTTFTIADDTLVTDYSQYYKPNRRIKAITPTGAVYGVIGSSTYSSGSTTVKVSMDGENVLPSSVTDVYIGLSSDDTAAFQGPNLLGMVLPWTADPDNIPVGFGLADGDYFDKDLYPALEELYDTGETDPDTGNKIYLHGGRTVNGVWQPLKPDVRGRFPRFMDSRSTGGLDPDAPRSVGSTQDDSLQGHLHAVTDKSGISGTSGAQYTGVAANSSSYGTTYTRNSAEASASTYGDVRVSSETRPTNIALPGLLVMYGGYSSATGIKVEDLLEMTEADAHDYIDSIASPSTEAVAEARGYAEDAKGYKNQASGFASDASGYATTAGGHASDAKDYRDAAQGYASDASGYKNDASGYASDALGYKNDASGYASDALGYKNDASGYASDASGYATQASGHATDAQGYANEAKGYRNQASGYADNAAASAAAAAAYKPVTGTYTLAAASWGVDGTQSVSITGLTTTATVFASPAPSADGSNETLYGSSGIRATAQAAGSLTFSAVEVPAADVDVVVSYFL